MPAPLLALIPALLPLAAPLIDRLGKALGLDRAAEVVSGVVATVTGTTEDAAVRTALADPDKAGAVLVQLETIAMQREGAAAQVTMAAEVARLGDVANARTRDTALQAVGVRNVRADVMVALVIVAVMAAMAFLYLGRHTPGGAIEGAILALIGGMSKCFYDAFQFEFGSSRGSADKSATISRALEASGQQQPAAIATTGTVNVSNAPSAPDTTADDLNASSLAQVRRGGTGGGLVG